MIKLTDKQIKIFGQIKLIQFKEKVIFQLDREFPFFPEINKTQKESLVSTYINSAFNLGIKIEKAVFNYVVTCWLLQQDIINNGASIKLLEQPTLSDVDKTEKLKRQAIVRYFTLLNQRSV